MEKEIHVEEHSSPIKTPTQLVAVVVLAFVVPVTLIAMIAHLATRAIDVVKDHPAMSDEAVAKRLKPVGEVVVADPNATKVAKSGKEIVDTVCAACHATGALNAPKIGDKAAWGKLIKEGHAKLTAEAIKGVRQMPPRGGNPDLTDTEVARAVAYMANQAGANFKDPESSPAPGAKPAAAAKPEPAAKPPAGGETGNKPAAK
jgi:cytochrome c5